MTAACESARLRASVALDGELDDVGRAQLARHLAYCADCARVAAAMEVAAELVRRAPHDRYRCRLHRARLLRSTSSTSGRRFAGAAVAVLAVVLATGALPGRETAPRPAAPPAARVSPLELPIGQRSAMDDFAASEAVGGVSTAAPHSRG